MPRPFDPARRCLPVTDWPMADRVLWEAALRPTGPEDETRSSAADWRLATQHKTRRGYGRWLNHLASSAPSDLALASPDRVTQERVRGYVAALRSQGCAGPLGNTGRRERVHRALALPARS